jgi:hypothetical protein
MQRFNMFNQIHKGLRAMLFDTALSLQQCNFMNPDDAESALEKVELAVNLFHSHAEHEDEFVLPVVEEHSPALATEFESEHEKDELLSNNLMNLLAAYQLASDLDAMRSVGYAITMAFNDFIAFNLYHMNKEEEKITKLMWENYSDAELMAINQAIVSSIPHEKMTTNVKWMIRGLNNPEIIGWLCAVKNNAPDFIFRSLFDQAEAELTEQRWTAIKEGLMEGAMMA